MGEVEADQDEMLTYTQRVCSKEDQMLRHLPVTHPNEET